MKIYEYRIPNSIRYLKLANTEYQIVLFGPNYSRIPNNRIIRCNFATSSLEGGYPTSAVVIDRVNILVCASHLYGEGPLGIQSPMRMIWLIMANRRLSYNNAYTSDLLLVDIRTDRRPSCNSQPMRE